MAHGTFWYRYWKSLSIITSLRHMISLICFKHRDPSNTHSPCSLVLPGSALPREQVEHAPKGFSWLGFLHLSTLHSGPQISPCREGITLCQAIHGASGWRQNLYLVWDSVSLPHFSIDMCQFSSGSLYTITGYKTSTEHQRNILINGDVPQRRRVN